MRQLGVFVAVLVLSACSAPEPGEPAGSPAEVLAPAPTSVVAVAAASTAPSASAPTPLGFPFLVGESADSSVSVGDTSHGRLIGARAVVESRMLKILPKQKARDLGYGTTALVNMLENAASRLHASTGTTLWIGNVGRREGGDIAWSVSHNTGRDADVAFCYRDRAGAPVDPEDLLPVGASGRTKEGRIELDVGRTWNVVRSMLEFPGAEVQYLFVSEPIKRMLLDQARASRAPARIVARAADVLRQPSGAPHDDHLHVRIYCAELDVAGGCENTGLIHPFAKVHAQARSNAAALARKQATDASPSAREKALLRLGIVGGPEDLRAALAGLEDPIPAVRRASARAVAALGREREGAALVKRFRDERDPDTALAFVEAAGSLGGPEVGAMLRDLLLADPFLLEPGTMSPPPPRPSDLAGPLRLLEVRVADPSELVDRRTLRWVAVRASIEADRLEPFGPLLNLVDPKEPELGREALRTLAFVTNVAPPRRPGGAEGDRLSEARAFYTKLGSLMGKSPREAWLVRGFSGRGYGVRALDGRFAWELVRAVADEEATSYNARRALARITNDPPDSLGWSAADACRHYRGVLEERSRELGVGRPSATQRAGCERAPPAE